MSNTIQTWVVDRQLEELLVGLSMLSNCDSWKVQYRNEQMKPSYFKYLRLSTKSFIDMHHRGRKQPCLDIEFENGRFCLLFNFLLQSPFSYLLNHPILLSWFCMLIALFVCTDKNKQWTVAVAFAKAAGS